MESIVKCGICNKEMKVVTPSHLRSHRLTNEQYVLMGYDPYSQKSRQLHSMPGKKNPAYKQGRWLSGNGYYYTSINGKDMPEHRYVAEQYLGRKLSAKEHVHHKNGVKTDNRPINLEILSSRDHRTLETTKMWEVNGSLRIRNPRVPVMCSQCGENFTKIQSHINTHKKLGLKHHFCNQKCYGKWRSIKSRKTGTKPDGN